MVQVKGTDADRYLTRPDPAVRVILIYGADGGLVAETQQTMKNIESLLATMGASMTDVVKTTCFLTDMEDYKVFNEHYVAAFGNHRPSRSCVAVAELPAGFVVEVEAWAYKPA